MIMLLGIVFGHLALALALPSSSARAAAVPAAFATQVVAGSTLAASGAAWARRLSKDADHGAVLSAPISDQRVPAGHVGIRTGSGAVITSNYASLPIEIRVNGSLVRTVYAGYRIVAYVQAPTLRSSLRSGHLIAPEDLTYARVESDGRRVPALEDLTGRLLAVDLPAAAELWPEQTVTDEIVKAGAPVVLIVHDGPIALAADVIARTSGGLGETVTVYDEHARRMLSGTVTAPSRVEFTLPEVSAQ